MQIETTELKERIERARELMSRCRLCPRECGVERLKGEAGFCKAGPSAKIYSYRQYLGEEPPISGKRGSGVIFFSHCTMRCAYCQNSSFSQHGSGYEVDPDTLSKMMLSLKARGCHNINLVTPSHYLPAALEALLSARERSLDIPIVYNTSGYEAGEVLEVLNGVVDIYLPDMRYSDNRFSLAYSQAADYVEVNRRAVREMHRQVGGLSLKDDGTAERGLIIRHLVMPDMPSNTDGVLKYISDHISKDTYISFMSQYIPLHNAKKIPEISRRITQEEYKAACALLEKYNLTNGWLQEQQ